MNSLDLKGRKILVTGASGGIGLAISKYIAESNGFPIMHYNKNDAIVSQCLNELKEKGKDGSSIQFDINNEADVKDKIKQLKNKYETLDGLVNNAGILTRGFIATHSTKIFSEVLNVNLIGNFCVLKYVSQVMINQKSGTIVNISSLAGIMGLRGQAAYSASKAGINALTIVAAKEMAAHNIRVNSVAPGYIKAGMLNNPTENDMAYIEKIPLKRFGYDYEVANAVIFLLSEASSYITGQSIIIDGGLSISN
jgi:3-oxoacyl-[acyl-carrier protein] reductase